MATVFIVDDEPMLHELYGAILEMGWHEIVANAYNGDEAVEIWSRIYDPPEIIIMDHRMPNKDGVETMKEILKINPNAKIIFATLTPLSGMMHWTQAHVLFCQNHSLCLICWLGSKRW